MSASRNRFAGALHGARAAILITLVTAETLGVATPAAAAGAPAPAAVGGAGPAESQVAPIFRPGRAPIGRIYTTTLSIPSVLAGGATALIVRYSIGDLSYEAAGAPLLAYVELCTAKGVVIRRSDPFEIQPAVTAGLQTATIPYEVPVDAGGSYTLRVRLRAAGGGAIATGNFIPLLVSAGPDPQPEVHAEFRASGALEVGPNATSSATFNPGALVALQWPTYTISLSGLFDPVSRRSDPLIVAESRAPGAVSSPNAPAPAASPDAPQPAASPEVAQSVPVARGTFKDTLGLGSAVLPPLLGEGTSLRGLDASRTIGPWTLHGAYGYAQLAVSGLPAERAGILDVAHTLGAGSVRAALYHRDDDVPGAYVVTPGVFGPLRATIASLDLSEPLARTLTLTAGAARSRADSLVQPLAAGDTSERVELAYALGATTARLEYHNAGDGFATGAGPGATSDRAGWTSALGFALSPKATLTLGAEREATRSVFSRQGSTNATLNLTPSATTQLSFGIRRDTQTSTSAAVTADQVDASVNTAAWGGQLSLTGSVVGLSDALSPANAAATRSATLQFSKQRNAHTLGFGLSGTAITGAGANAQVAESLTYGFPVGGRLVNGMLLHGFELQFAATNTTASSVLGVAADRALSTIVSYHLTKHVAVGVRGELHRHAGVVLGPLAAPSALRLRLDLVQ